MEKKMINKKQSEEWKKLADYLANNFYEEFINIFTKNFLLNENFDLLITKAINFANENTEKLKDVLLCLEKSQINKISFSNDKGLYLINNNYQQTTPVCIIRKKPDFLTAITILFELNSFYKKMNINLFFYHKNQNKVNVCNSNINNFKIAFVCCQINEFHLQKTNLKRISFESNKDWEITEAENSKIAISITDSKLEELQVHAEIKKLYFWNSEIQTLKIFKLPQNSEQNDINFFNLKFAPLLFVKAEAQILPKQENEKSRWSLYEFDIKSPIRFLRTSDQQAIGYWLSKQETETKLKNDIRSTLNMTKIDIWKWTNKRKAIVDLQIMLQNLYQAYLKEQNQQIIANFNALSTRKKYNQICVMIEKQKTKRGAQKTLEIAVLKIWLEHEIILNALYNSQTVFEQKKIIIDF